MPSSPPPSRRRSRACAESRWSSAGSGRAGSSPPPRTRPGASGCTRRCRWRRRRRLAPNAAYLVPRFSLYRAVSEQVMELLRQAVAAGGAAEPGRGVRRPGGGRGRPTTRRRRGRPGSGCGPTSGPSPGSPARSGSPAPRCWPRSPPSRPSRTGWCSSSRARSGSCSGPMSVRTLPGVGPATGEHLRRAGMTTVADLAEAGEDELVRLLGKAHGASLYRMALGHDDRPVVAERDAKSVSVEDTFDVDLHDRVRVRTEVERLADRCVQRLRASGRSGRTDRAEGAAVRLLDADALRDAARAHGRPRRWCGRPRRGCWRPWTPRAGCGCWGWASPGSRTTPRRICSPRPPPASRPTAGGRGRDEPEAAASGGGRAGGRRPEPAAGAAEEPGRPSGAGRPGTTYGMPSTGAGWVQGSGVGRVTVRFEEPGSRARPGAHLPGRRPGAGAGRSAAAGAAPAAERAGQSSGRRAGRSPGRPRRPRRGVSGGAETSRP